MSAVDTAIAAEELIERLTVVHAIAMVSLPLPLPCRAEETTETLVPAEAA